MASDEELAAFAATAKPARRSPATDYADDIYKLLALGVTQVKVLEWLAMPPRSVKLTKPDLSRWLSRRRERINREARRSVKPALASSTDSPQPDPAAMPASPAPHARVAVPIAKTSTPHAHAHAHAPALAPRHSMVRAADDRRGATTALDDLIREATERGEAAKDIGIAELLERQRGER